jgi:hypothetical protein
LLSPRWFEDNAVKQFTLILIAGALAAFMNIAPAKADILYTLTYDSCSGGCGNGSGTNNNTFGYIDIHQVNASSVTLTETLSSNSVSNLNDNNYFVNTGSGNHQPFAFNVDKTIVISNVQPSTYFTAGSGSVNISGLGTYSNYIACTSACGSGASNASSIGQSLTFSTSDGSTLTAADFINNASGFIFSSDIIGGLTGNTGEVAAQAGSACNTATTTCAGYTGGSSQVPEPSTIVIFGSALIAIGLVRRRYI